MNVVPWPTLAGDGDPPAVQRDQLVHQRQPDARALVGAGARPLDAVKALEQPGQLGGGDADAGVRHLQLDVIAGGPQRDRDAARRT